MASRQVFLPLFGTLSARFSRPEPSDYIWGVVDMIPDTDFPDIRCKCAVHSNNGSCMIIPREGDKIRLYIQISGKDVLDPATGRVDKSRFGPDKILEVAKKSFHPFVINQTGEIDWWTLYLSASASVSV